MNGPDLEIFVLPNTGKHKLSNRKGGQVTGAVIWGVRNLFPIEAAPQKPELDFEN